MRTLIAAALSLLVLAPFAHADEDKPVYPLLINLLGGGYVDNIAHSPLSSSLQLAYGGALGYEFVHFEEMEEFSSIAFQIHYDHSRVTSILGANTVDTFLGQLTFRKVDGPLFYFGPEAGIVRIGQAPVITVPEVGGLTGIEFPVSSQVTFGPEINVAYHFKGTGAANGTTYVVDGALTAKFLFVLSIHL